MCRPDTETRRADTSHEPCHADPSFVPCRSGSRFTNLQLVNGTSISPVCAEFEPARHRAEFGEFAGVPVGECADPTRPFGQLYLQQQSWPRLSLSLTHTHTQVFALSLSLSAQENPPHKYHTSIDSTHPYQKDSIFCTIIYKMIKLYSLLLPYSILLLINSHKVESSKCHGSCDALASYYVWGGSNLSFIAAVMGTNLSNIMGYNPQIMNVNLIYKGDRLNVPFKCGCLNDFLGHQFSYVIKSGNTYSKIAETIYSRLTTVEMLMEFNSYDPDKLPDQGARLNVTVKCFCGNGRVSKDYGLFVTYPIRPGENLSSIANRVGLPEKLLSDYNPGMDFSSGNGLVFIPGKDQTRSYPPFISSGSSGIHGGVTAGLSIAGVIGALSLAACFYFGFYRRKKLKERSLKTSYDDHAMGNKFASGLNLEKNADSGHLHDGVFSELTDISMDKSLEFSYKELAEATDNFSLAKKIGQGGFGSVYYAELRGEKAAVKKMDMHATKAFLAELKVLTHVHHLNLVRLIGYSVESSLLIVYEYIDNGNLCQHLRGLSGKGPLSWSSRLQIALDSARGLEYIHEHTNPAYIHRDIKSPNILLDKQLRAKVADFGLTKLVEVGTGSLQTRLVGTFGYMPPEYAQYGEVSTKIDVYAFGVLLYELISAREAIGNSKDVSTRTMGLVTLFEEVMNLPDPTTDLPKLVDPRLEDYPIDSVYKIAQLAKACTNPNPVLRPSMRAVVVALMTISSGAENWYVGSLDENQSLVNLMSGR